jgi:hypothetical protein
MYELSFLSNADRWQNVLFYMCCYHKESFRSSFNMSHENVDMTFLLKFLCCSKFKGNMGERRKRHKSAKGMNGRKKGSNRRIGCSKK